MYSTAHVYINWKMQIKRAKNHMQLRIKKIMRVKKSYMSARLWDINIISMYLLLFQT